MANRLRTFTGIIQRELPTLLESVETERKQARIDGILIGLANVKTLTHRDRALIFYNLTGELIKPHHFPLAVRKAEARQ